MTFRITDSPQVSILAQAIGTAYAEQAYPLMTELRSGNSKFRYVKNTVAAAIYGQLVCFSSKNIAAGNVSNDISANGAAEAIPAGYMVGAVPINYYCWILVEGEIAVFANVNVTKEEANSTADGAAAAVGDEIVPGIVTDGLTAKKAIEAPADSTAGIKAAYLLEVVNTKRVCGHITDATASAMKVWANCPRSW